MSHDGVDEGPLLDQATQGNRDALRKLLFRHHARLKRELQPMIGTRLGRLISTDDILQETFIQAHQTISSFRPEGPHAFYAWLKTIALNRLRDAGRKHQRMKRGGDRQLAEQRIRNDEGEYADLVAELSDAGDSPSRVAAGHEAVQAIQVAMMALVEDQRQALTWHCLQKLSLEDTANRMGRSTGSVRGLIQRAKLVLREQLQDSTLWFSRK